MQRGTKGWTVVAASAVVLLASSGLAMASQSLAKPAQAQTLRVGEGYVRTYFEGATPMVAISLDGRSEQRVVEQRGTLHLRYASFDPGKVVPAVPAALRAVPENRAFIVQYISQPLESYKAAIEGLGGTVERFLPDQAQIVTIDADRVGALAALPFVRWVGEYHPAYKLDEPDLQRLVLGAAGDSPVVQRYSVQTLRRGNGSIDDLTRAIAGMGAAVTMEVPQVGRLEAWLSDEQLLAVAQRSDVLFMDVRGEAEPDVDIARMIGGANYIESVAGFTGQGVRAEVLDLGLFQGHQEFNGMNILLHGPVTVGSHGTSVFSIVFAQGTNPQARGFLPDAEQPIMSDQASLGNRYTHTQELVDPAGPFRAVLQTNSWGDARVTDYTTVSAEMDDILFDFDIVITQSQSNSGSTPSRPQAWAKNIVSVGAANHFNTLDRADDRHGGAAGSTGPAADGRIKPDLSHFYDQTIAATTGAATSYTQFGGTSGATPITAGHFGLFFQMWNEGAFGPVRVPGGTVFENRPTSSTAKAMLINTGLQYTFTSPTADLHRFRQGWGLADVKKLYDERERFFIVDGTDRLTPLASNSYPLKVAGDEPDLRVTMVYRDPSGTTSATKHRINDLTMKVTSPSGVVYWGNNGLTSGNFSVPGGSANDLDNVENVLVQSPEGGVWTVEIIASEINQDGDASTPALDATYSLVVAGVTPAIGLAMSNPVPEIVLPGTVLTIDAEVIEGDEALVGTPRIFFDMTGSGFTQANMVASGDTWTFDLPETTCGTSPAFYLEATGDGGTTVTLPALGADGPFRVNRVGEDLDFGTFDFQTAPGWTVQDTTVIDGRWVLGVPDGFRGAPDSDFDGSGNSYLTGSGSGQDIDGGPTRLLSPTLNLLGAPDDLKLNYARWFTNDDQKAGLPDLDRLVVEISDNGGSTWVPLESVSHAMAAEEWAMMEWTISDHVNLTDRVQVRFTVSDNPNDSRTEAAVDAFSVTGFRCVPTDCLADLDGDGELTIFDFLEFQNLFASGDVRADLDGDGELTLFDFLSFQNLFATGC